MRLPSVETLRQIARTLDCAKDIRRILEQYQGYSVLDALERCSGYMTCGNEVETIPHGHNAKSPTIHYVNTGDTYRTTLMYVCGRGYVVGAWGDIVERGNYD
jgi:hypothetical protein